MWVTYSIGLTLDINRVAGVFQDTIVYHITKNWIRFPFLHSLLGHTFPIPIADTLYHSPLHPCFLLFSYLQTITRASFHFRRIPRAVEFNSCGMHNSTSFPPSKFIICSTMHFNVRRKYSQLLFPSLSYCVPIIVDSCDYQGINNHDYYLIAKWSLNLLSSQLSMWNHALATKLKKLCFRPSYSSVRSRGYNCTGPFFPVLIQ